MEKLIGYCGIDCNDCEAYIATQDENIEKLEQISKKWSNDQINFSVDDIECKGCFSQEKIFSWCSNCDIRNCGMEKGLENCAECENFDNCESLTMSHERNSQARKNLLSFKKTH